MLLVILLLLVLFKLLLENRVFVLSVPPVVFTTVSSYGCLADHASSTAQSTKPLMQLRLGLLLLFSLDSVPLIILPTSPLNAQFVALLVLLLSELSEFSDSASSSSTRASLPARLRLLSEPVGFHSHSSQNDCAPGTS